MPRTTSRGKRHALVLLPILLAVTAVSGVLVPRYAEKSPGPSRRPILPVAMKLSHATPAPMPTIGRPAPEKWPDAPVTLNTLHRDSYGAVLLTLTVQNNGDEQYSIPPGWYGAVFKYNAGVFNGITLTDESAKIRYYPLLAKPSGDCVCTVVGKISMVLEHGEYAVVYSVFKLPPNVKTVTVGVPDYSPAANIPIS